MTRVFQHTWKSVRRSRPWRFMVELFRTEGRRVQPWRWYVGEAWRDPEYELLLERQGIEIERMFPRPDA
jgi:hypothetical protein